jgi:hypothetical protein
MPVIKSGSLRDATLTSPREKAAAFSLRILAGVIHR